MRWGMKERRVAENNSKEWGKRGKEREKKIRECKEWIGEGVGDE